MHRKMLGTALYTCMHTCIYAYIHTRRSDFFATRELICLRASKSAGTLLWCAYTCGYAIHTGLWRASIWMRLEHHYCTYMLTYVGMCLGARCYLHLHDIHFISTYKIMYSMHVPCWYQCICALEHTLKPCTRLNTCVCACVCMRMHMYAYILMYICRPTLYTTSAHQIGIKCGEVSKYTFEQCTHPNTHACM